MTGEMAAFGIAVGGTSLVCYVLMTRLQNPRANRRSPGDGSSPDGGNYTGADGWSISSWFGCDNPAFDSPGDPSDSGGSDSGGGDGEVATGVAEAISNSRLRTTPSILIYRKRNF
jgi:hypothetical protein